MTPRGEWLRQPGSRHLLLAAAASIPHVFVEWISGPRNLFLILLRVAQGFGYRPAVLNRMNEKLTRLRGQSDPVLRHDRFVEEIARAKTIESELQAL